MTVIQGDIMRVAGGATRLQEVYFYAPRYRPHGGGVITTERHTAPVNDKGHVRAEVRPGAARLVIPGVADIPMIVPETGPTSLQECIEAARLADETERAILEELAGKVAADVAKARNHAQEASESATRAGEAVEATRGLVGEAEGQARAAGVARDGAVTAKEGAEQAVSMVGAQLVEAEYFKSQAERAAKVAASDVETVARDKTQVIRMVDDVSAIKGQAVEAATRAEGHAGATARDVETVSNVLDSTRWEGDRLSVLGVTSPHLTGPKGEQGPQGPKGEPGAPGRDGDGGVAGLIAGQPGTGVEEPKAGPQAYAIGALSEAKMFGTAIGYSSNAEQYGIAIGRGVQAKGYSINIGYGSSGDVQCTAIGMSASANEAGTAIGVMANAQNYGVGIGCSASAQANSSAIGLYARSGMFGTAIGYGAQADGYGVAIGAMAQANECELALGNPTMHIKIGVTEGAIEEGVREEALDYMAQVNPNGTPKPGEITIGHDFSVTHIPGRIDNPDIRELMATVNNLRRRLDEAEKEIARLGGVLENQPPLSSTINQPNSIPTRGFGGYIFGPEVTDSTHGSALVTKAYVDKLFKQRS